MLPLATPMSLFGFYCADLTLTASFSNFNQADTIADVNVAHASGQKILLIVHDLTGQGVGKHLPNKLHHWLYQST